MDSDKEFRLIEKVLKKSKLGKYHYETIFKEQGFTDEEAIICLKEGEPWKILQQLIPLRRHLMRFTTELAKQAGIESVRAAKEQNGELKTEVLEQRDNSTEDAAAAATGS